MEDEFADMAGGTAAPEATKHGLNVFIAEKLTYGGLIANVNELLPSAGPASSSGSEFAAEAMVHVADFDAVSLFESVRGFQPNADGTMTVTISTASYRARTVVVATGDRLGQLYIAEEEGCGHSEPQRGGARR